MHIRLYTTLKWNQMFFMSFNNSGVFFFFFLINKGVNVCCPISERQLGLETKTSPLSHCSRDCFTLLIPLLYLSLAFSFLPISLYCILTRQYLTDKFRNLYFKRQDTWKSCTNFFLFRKWDLTLNFFIILNF